MTVMLFKDNLENSEAFKRLTLRICGHFWEETFFTEASADIWYTTSPMLSLINNYHSLFSPTNKLTHTHTHALPPEAWLACIYLFVIFPNSVWRMSDRLTPHSARLIERHNIYVAETANYPTIYHQDYLSDWKLLVHVIGIIWN